MSDDNGRDRDEDKVVDFKARQEPMLSDDLQKILGNVHISDQVAEAMMGMAALVYAYYRGLRKAGFEQPQALKLTIDYQAVVVRHGLDKGSK